MSIEKIEKENQYVKIFASESVFIVNDLDFIRLMKQFFTKLSAEDIYFGFEWNKIDGYCIYYPNMKRNIENLKKNPKREHEGDYLQYFIDNEIIPEGNYLIMVTEA